MVLRLQKSAPNSWGLFSGFHSVSHCLLVQVSFVVSSVSCYRWKNRLHATSQLLPPRTRVARTLQQKTSFLLPDPRPIGRGRYEVRPHLSCVRSFHFPPLPRPTCFLVSGQHNVYWLHWMAQHQLAISLLPKGTLGCCQAHAAMAKHNVRFLVPDFYTMFPGQRQNLSFRFSSLKNLPIVSRPHPTHPFRCGIFLKTSIK